jgi:peptidyl-prolyl cis-trans isomerase C
MAVGKLPPRAWLAVAFAAALVPGVLTLGGCTQAVGPDKAPVAGDVAVAKVDGHTVWTSDVKAEAVAQGLIGEGEPLDRQSDLFRRVMDELVDRHLLVEEAVRRKLDKSPLAERRLAAAHDRMLADMLVDDVVGKAVNEDAIRGLYQEQVKLAKQTEEFHLRQIVSATQADADAIRKQLAAGAAFDGLAVQRSTDPATRFNGGDMGYITSDVLPAAYGPAIAGAKVGDLVGPFRIDGGFTVVRVEDRRAEAPITLEAARPQIVRFLTYDQVRSLIADLRGKSKIDTLLPKAPDVPGAPREPASAPPGAGPPASAPEPPMPAKMPPLPISPTPGSGIPMKPMKPGVH